MFKTLVLFLLCFITLGIGQAIAQDLKTTVNENKELDSLRNKLENGEDSVVFTSKYVRYTTLKLTKDSLQTLPLDTSLRNFQNYSPIAQPYRPVINTGNIGLAARALLFEPSKTIGFDAGFHSLDWYAMNHDDIIYYQARSPFTNLYYAGQLSGDAEQIFRVKHSQNVKKNFNIGASYNRIGANGNYTRQRGDVLNGTFFTWYTSPNKRYTLFANAIFNTLKAYENGSTTNDTLFTGQAGTVDRMAESVRLNNSRQIYRKNTFLVKQTYFVGRIDTMAQEISQKVLPTNKITYSLKYDKDSYAFQKDEDEDHTVLTEGIQDTKYTNDSTSVSHIQNEFIYSFFLRGKGSAVVKNELKIDAGIRHDFYNYSQVLGRADTTEYYRNSKSFQNITLLGALGYRFSNKINLNVDVQQIFQGRQAGDYLYEAKSNVLLSKNVGRIVLGAYLQNKSPEEIYVRYYGNHYRWLHDDSDPSEAARYGQTSIQNFERTKTVNLSFKYINDKLKFDATAEYFLINNYLYFTLADATGVDSTSITPAQVDGSINLIKFTLGKKLKFGKFSLDSYVVYQKTDNAAILRTPELYMFHSFYVNQTVFKVLKTDIGFDVHYNSKYNNYRYSPAASQFYITNNDTKFSSYPVVDVWLRVSLRKANIFLKYDYANQGIQSNGYYTVNKYPMPDRLLKFGVSWNFYD
ncbi:putative porin [Pedobacter sp. AW31-3R]|uniref:putative porin n=1 Tax=Pedobacter sp. AW31-3R TaxID=3445781 RepID=UPI003FA09EFF